jgi:hypothetical protein
VKLYVSIPKHKRFANADEAADYWDGLTSELVQRPMGYQVGWDKEGEDLVETYKPAVEEMRKNQTLEEKMMTRWRQLEGEKLNELSYPEGGLSKADSRAIIDTLKAEGYTIPAWERGSREGTKENDKTTLKSSNSESDRK